jgi:hypothetical protein
MRIMRINKAYYANATINLRYVGQETSTRTMKCNEIIKTADYDKTNNYIMKMMRDDNIEKEQRKTRTLDDDENA